MMRLLLSNARAGRFLPLQNKASWQCSIASYFFSCQLQARRVERGRLWRRNAAPLKADNYARLKSQITEL